MQPDSTTPAPGVQVAHAALALQALFPEASTRAIADALRVLGLKFRNETIREILRGTSVPSNVVALRPGRTRDARGRTFPSRGAQVGAAGAQSSAPTHAPAARGVGSNKASARENDQDLALATASSVTPSLADRGKGDDSLRSSSQTDKVFALEQPPAAPKRKRAAYAGSLVPPDPVKIAGSELCQAVWARLEQHQALPRGWGYSDWRAKNSREAQGIIASGVGVPEALAAWDRCLSERRMALYAISTLRREISRQAADDRDRGGGAGGRGWTEAELDED